MSGFVARAELDGALHARTPLEPMAKAIAFRGSLAHSQYGDRWAGLGNLRRNRHGGEQASEPVPVASDSRLDNRSELANALGYERQEAEISDAQLIWAAYRRWGERCVERLLGDFAFVIWDEPRRRIFAARDPMGVRPFYYHQREKTFVAASAIAALKADPELPRRLDEGKIANYLASITTDHISTSYRDIARLPPAHCLSFDEAGLKTWRYWALDPGRVVVFEDPKDYVQAFAELFQRAVERRIDGNARTGSYLSGGLDSSAVTTVASSSGQAGPWPTFSAVFPSVPRSDEREFVDAVLAKGDFDPYYVWGDEIDLLENLESELARDDDISPGFNSFINHALLKEAAAQGIEVILDGYDGDTTLSHGRRLVAQHLAALEWIPLMRELRALKSKRGRKPLKTLWNYGVASLAPASWRMLWRRADGRNPLTGHRDWIIAPAFAARVGLSHRLAAAADIRLRPTVNERLHHYLRLTNMNVQQLEHSGHTAALCGVEQRYPFCDRQLVEFCLALPGNMKMQAGENRWICREALKGKLPERVRGRLDKGNLSYNFDAALRRTPAGAVASMIARASSRLAPYLDVDRVQHMCWDYFRNGESRHSGVVWKVLKLGRWLELSGLQP